MAHFYAYLILFINLLQKFENMNINIRNISGLAIVSFIINIYIL